jgi:hypothetical protein
MRAWHEVEEDFLECEYRAVRDRQMKELEMEDDLLNKVPVRYVNSFCSLKRVLPCFLQKSPSQALQRIIRVRPAAENTMPVAGRVVCQCRPAVSSYTPRYRASTNATVAIHAAGTTYCHCHSITDAVTKWSVSYLECRTTASSICTMSTAKPNSPSGTASKTSPTESKSHKSAKSRQVHAPLRPTSCCETK